MNRYRTIPGTGPAKATASTTCQKCLKKDSYECKAGTQERPYTSRPSRTQQLFNPKLAPKLNNDAPNDLLTSKGVADRQLAEAEAKRNAMASAMMDVPDQLVTSRDRSRSRSISTSSVSTISTSRSRSRSPYESHSLRDHPRGGRPGRPRSRTPSPSHSRKRKHRSISSASRSPEALRRREPGSHRKSRRHRTVSPIDRGRTSTLRRGSHRSRSNSPSMDKSQVTKLRRSLDNEYDEHDEDSEGGHRHGYGGRSHDGQRGRYDYAEPPRQPKRERSLSPYSKRLALTQAMNL